MQVHAPAHLSPAARGAAPVREAVVAALRVAAGGAAGAHEVAALLRLRGRRAGRLGNLLLRQALPELATWAKCMTCR